MAIDLLLFLLWNIILKSCVDRINVSLSQSCRHLVAPGLIRQKAPSYFFYFSLLLRPSSVASGAEASVGRGKAVQRDEALALLAVLGQPVRVEVQRDISHHSRHYRHRPFWPTGGGAGRAASAAAEDPISDKLTKRSRWPQISSVVVLVRMSEEWEGKGRVVVVVGGGWAAFTSICFLNHLMVSSAALVSESQ